MPQADKSAPEVQSSPGRSEFEGKEFTTDSPEDLENALRFAFDYRGDVTLDFHDGSSIEGYLHNYDLQADTLSIFIKESKRESSDSTVHPSQITKVRFTGPDLAFGTSWEDWMAKSEKQKRAEAERLKKEAEEKGLL